jgi:hypothetical protein
MMREALCEASNSPVIGLAPRSLGKQDGGVDHLSRSVGIFWQLV